MVSSHIIHIYFIEFAAHTKRCNVCVLVEVKVLYLQRKQKKRKKKTKHISSFIELSANAQLIIAPRAYINMLFYATLKSIIAHTYATLSSFFSSSISISCVCGDVQSYHIIFADSRNVYISRHVCGSVAAASKQTIVYATHIKMRAFIRREYLCKFFVCTTY